MADLSSTPLSHRLVTLLVFVLLLPPHAEAFSFLQTARAETPLSSWQPAEGDALVVDTEGNIGYLVHEDGGFTSFIVVTGQRRTVHYIGRTYNARTPEKSWTVLSKHTKGDHTTFGPQGLFLRLYDKYGETAYGIHTHRSAETMLAEEERYRSMGCIIVSQDVLDVIERTFEGNGQQLQVRTVRGLGESIVTYDVLREKPAAK